MIQLIRSEQRHFADFGWLRTNWLFSFDQYYDPANLQFGNLRVFNDDWIAANGGFDTHPHREMEIVTIVNSGAVSHADSMGNRTRIVAGEVQRMSAGTGILHSEHNRESIPLELFQIWFLPSASRLPPSYAQKQFSNCDFRAGWNALVTPDGRNGSINMHADASIFRADPESGSKLTFKVSEGRGAFLYVTSGEIRVNQFSLQSRDQLRVTDIGEYELNTIEDASLLLIDARL